MSLLHIFHNSVLLWQACNDAVGLGGMITLSQQFTQVVLTGIALYFFVGLVINLAQAQVSSASGDHAGYAHALEQGILMIILLALAVALPSLGETIRAWLVCSDGSAASAVALWKSLAKMIVSIILGGAGVLTMVSAVWSGVELQMATLLGIPGGVSSGLRRLLLLVGGGILTISAVLIANTLLSLYW
jgi:hypothetical protein